MALLTHQWQAPDTSFISRLIMAGAEMRQRQEQQQASAARELAAAAERSRMFQQKMEFEKEQAAQLAQQFQVQHAFRVGQEQYDRTRDVRKDRIEDADRAPFDPDAPALPSGSAAVAGPAAGPGLAASNVDPLAAAAASPAPLVGPSPNDPASPSPLKPWLQFRTGESQAPSAMLVGPTQTGEPLGAAVDPADSGLPAPQLTGGANTAPGDVLPVPGAIPSTRVAPAVAANPQTISGAMGVLRGQLKGLPTGDARKILGDTARTLVVNANRPSAALGSAMETMPDGSIRIGASLYRQDPRTGQMVKIGVAQRVGSPLLGPNGETVVPMANGQFLVDGVVMDAPPGGITRLPGATEERRADLAEEVADVRKEQGQARIDIAEQGAKTREQMRRRDELLRTIESDRREADRAQSDLEAHRKDPPGKPTKDGDKYKMGRGDISKERYEHLLEKHEAWKVEDEALQRRASTHRAAATTAQKQLDAMMQGVNPDKTAKPAVPPAGEAPAAAPAAKDEIDVPGGEAYPVGTRAKRGGVWMVKQASGKWLAE